MTNKRPARKVFRFDVWWCSIPAAHTLGAEFNDGKSGPHPFLVLSINELTRLGLCVGVPGTSHEPREDAPYHDWRIRIRPEDITPHGSFRPLDVDTYFCCEHVRSVAVDRLTEKAGRVIGKVAIQVEEAVRKALGLPEI